MQPTTTCLAAALALTACSNAPERQGDAARAETASPARPITRPDPGPSISRVTGRARLTDRGAVDVDVRARAMADGHFYAVVPLPAEVAGPLTEADALHFAVRGDRYGFAVPFNARAGDADAARALIVRFVGDNPPADGVEIVAAGARPLPVHDDDFGVKLALRMRGTGSAPVDATLPARFRRDAADFFRYRARISGLRSDPFSAFAAARLDALAGDAAAPAERAFRPGRADVAELMDLYTGLASVEEALQTDRGLLVRSGSAGARTVSLADVKGVPAAAHPWEAMIAELPGSPAPKIEPLAAIAPSDAIYLHFHDLRTFVNLARLADEWVAPVGRALEESAGDAHFVDRYETQLAVERTGLAEKIGHLAASGVAVVVGDPLLREGTDVSLVFAVRGRALLTTALSGFEANALARRPDATVSTYRVGEHEVRRFGTPDHVIEQHRLELGDVLILANSRAAIDTFIAVRSGARPALASSGDFRYMRTIYPFDTAQEDGFAFFGDALVSRVTGPRFKVLQARRMAARADLQAVGFTAMLYGWFEGHAPASVDALRASGLLDAADLAHADGTPIELDLARGARSAAWGTVAALTPLAEKPIDSLTAEEAEGYARFRDTYQQYWRTYIDPIAVRIRRAPDGDGLDLDARMLPLIERSDYDQLIEQVGRQTVGVPRVRGGAQMTVALGRDARLRRELDGVGRWLHRQDLRFGWIGDWVAIGAADRSGLWDAAVHERAVPTLRSTRSKTELALAARLPIYAAVHVQDRLVLAATLGAAKAFVESAAAGMVRWGPGAPYRGVETVIVAHTERHHGQRGDEIELHYAVAEDVLLVALERPVLELQIDAVLAGFENPEDRPTAQSAVALSPASADGWMVKLLHGLLEHANRQATRAALRAEENLVRGLGPSPADPAARRARALGWLGVEPSCAAGGVFSDGADGGVEHSVYGSVIEPIVPQLPIPGAPMTRVLGALEQLEMHLSFEGEGRHRGLHTGLTWRWRGGQ